MSHRYVPTIPAYFAHLLQNVTALDPRRSLRDQLRDHPDFPDALWEPRWRALLQDNGAYNHARYLTRLDPQRPLVEGLSAALHADFSADVSRQLADQTATVKPLDPATQAPGAFLITLPGLRVPVSISSPALPGFHWK